jgi:hypothetical protein
MSNQMIQRLAKWVMSLAVAGFGLAAWPAPAQQVLVVSVTKGFRHDVIPTVDKLMGELAQKSGKFTVDYVTNDEEMKAKMTPEALRKYGAVIFNNTTGDLPLPDREAFLAWLKSGKGFVGFHAATDTFPGFPAYDEMIGAHFRTHHEQVEVEALNLDPNHPATRHLPPAFKVRDEIYLVRKFDRSKVHGLLTMDTHPNYGIPGDYPIAWCKSYGQGRVFYTSLGHRVDVVERPDIQQHYLAGILWALGLEKGDATPQGASIALRDPEAREGFRWLFNCEDLAGWHLREPGGTQSWSPSNGTLANRVPEGGHGTDLVTDEKFMNFTVRFDYKVPKGSNSGFYLRGRYEIQILDDGDATTPSPSSNGAFYSLAAPAKFASRKAEEWQTVEATLVGNKATVILNGVKIHDNVTLDRGTGGQLDNNLSEPGPILLQGNHGNVTFRNLRIKVLPQ